MFNGLKMNSDVKTEVISSNPDLTILGLFFQADPFVKGVMFTTGSVLAYTHLADNLDGFYDGLISQPYMHYSDTKAKLLLEAFMWKVRNKEAKNVYWTNYSLGMTKTGLTNRDTNGDFDPTKHED